MASFRQIISLRLGEILSLFKTHPVQLDTPIKCLVTFIMLKLFHLKGVCSCTGCVLKKPEYLTRTEWYDLTETCFQSLSSMRTRKKLNLLRNTKLNCESQYFKNHWILKGFPLRKLIFQIIIKPFALQWQIHVRLVKYRLRIPQF